MERTEIARYLASLTDDEFKTLTDEARPDPAPRRGTFQDGQELYRNNGRRTIEVDQRPEQIAWETK